MDDNLMTGFLAFLGSALLSYEINYIIWSIQEKRKPKRAPITDNNEDEESK